MRSGKIDTLGHSIASGRFIVIGDKALADGYAEHKDLLKEMYGNKFGDIENEMPVLIRKKILEFAGSDEEADMGFVGRDDDVVVVSGDSGTFMLPVGRCKVEARQKSIKVLENTYPNEKFRIGGY